jgi:hypothetical protein
MKARRQRASTARLVMILILLALAIVALYRLFYAVPPAPAPKAVQALWPIVRHA